MIEYDIEDESVFLPDSIIERLKALDLVIAQNTPEWVRSCRGKSHHPAMLEREGRRWWCVFGCGDDRTPDELFRTEP